MRPLLSEGGYSVRLIVLTMIILNADLQGYSFSKDSKGGIEDDECFLMLRRSYFFVELGDKETETSSVGRWRFSPPHCANNDDLKARRDGICQQGVQTP